MASVADMKIQTDYRNKCNLQYKHTLLTALDLIKELMLRNIMSTENLIREDASMADCDFEFAKGATKPKSCAPCAPDAIMPPIYNLDGCAYHGTCAIGLILSRNSPEEPMGNKKTLSRQTQFDLNLIQDRKYEYFATTNDDGWLCGGGENGDHCKIPAVDSAHITIAEIGTLDSKYGGIEVEYIQNLLTSGSILIPHMGIIPSFVFKNPDNPPEVELKFELAKGENNNNIEEYENWALPFLYNQIFDKLHNINPAIHGHMANENKRNDHYHVTLVRKSAWRNAKKMFDYFKKCSDVVKTWRETGPVYLEPEQNHKNPGFIGKDNSLRDENTNPHGIYLYKTRNEVIDYYSPNFHPPYNTPEKREIIQKWVLDIKPEAYK